MTYKVPCCLVFSHPSHLILQCFQNFTGPRQISNTSAHLLLWPYRCAHPSQIFSLNYSPSETILQHLHCESLAIPYLWRTDSLASGLPQFFHHLLLYTLHCIHVCMNIHVYIKWFYMQRIKL